MGTCPGCLGCLCECCGFVGNASLLTGTNETEQVISGAAAAAMASSSHFYVATHDNCEAMPPTGLGWDGAQYNISQATQRTYASYACRFNVRPEPRSTSPCDCVCRLHQANFVASPRNPCSQMTSLPDDDNRGSGEDEGGDGAEGGAGPKRRRGRRGAESNPDVLLKETMEDFIAQLQQRQSQFSDSQAHNLRKMVQQYLAEPATSRELPVLATGAPPSPQFAAKNLTQDTADVRSRRQSNLEARATPVDCNSVTDVPGTGVFVVRPTVDSDVLLSTCDNEIDTLFTIDGTRYDDGCGARGLNELIPREIAQRTALYFEVGLYGGGSTSFRLSVNCTAGRPRVTAPAECNSIVSANASNGLPATWALTPPESGNVIVSTVQSDKDTALNLSGVLFDTPAGPNITGTETVTEFVPGGQEFLIEAKFNDAFQSGLMTVEITCLGSAASVPTPAPTVFVAESGFGGTGERGPPLTEAELQTQAAFAEFLAITQSGDLNQTSELTITVQTEVDGKTIDRQVPKQIRRDASYVDIAFFTDSSCSQALQFPGANGSLADYTEQHSYHNSPINMPDRDIGPPYGVFCSGYAPVGQFRRESCTLADVSAKRDGCIQLINPLSGKYWYDTAFAACKNPSACDSRKIDIVAQAEQVKDIILQARDWLLVATIAQGLAIFIAVFLHFVFETLMGGNVFGHAITWVIFIIKNLLVFIAFVANVHLGRYLSVTTIDSGETATEWLDNFIDNECFDAQGTVILTETRSFVIDTATQMVVIGLIILIDALIEDNISIVIEGTRASKDEVKEAVDAIYQHNETLRQSIKGRPGLPKKKIVPPASDEAADSEHDNGIITVTNGAFEAFDEDTYAVVDDDASPDGYLHVGAVGSEAAPVEQAGASAVGGSPRAQDATLPRLPDGRPHAVHGQPAKKAGISAGDREFMELEKKQNAVMAQRKAEKQAKQAATNPSAAKSSGRAQTWFGMPPTTSNGGHAETQFTAEQPSNGDSRAWAIGDQVLVVGKGAGIIAFVGEHHVTGEYRIGVELDEPRGKNDGTVSGHRYFQCKLLHGVLTIPDRVSAAEDIYVNGSVGRRSTHTTEEKGSDGDHLGIDVSSAFVGGASAPPQTPTGAQITKKGTDWGGNTPTGAQITPKSIPQDQPRSSTAATAIQGEVPPLVDADPTAARIATFKSHNADEEPHDYENAHDYENSDAIVPPPDDSTVVLRKKKGARDGAAADDDGARRKTLWNEQTPRTASMGRKAKIKDGETGNGGNDRCPKCASKLAFCICNDSEARRKSMSENARDKVATATAAADANGPAKAGKKEKRRRKSKGPTCTYVNDEGRSCNTAPVGGKPQCANHACQMPDCTVGKSSRAEFCERHSESGI